MAWFGGNLKSLTDNLTGQLSTVATSAASFTRDVIAEGTEEVADQSTELQISEERVQRLETAVVGLKAENERLRTINSELEEKAEASELQIKSISSQYRSVLVEKEDQLNSLIQQQRDMQDLHQSMMSSTADHPALTAATSTTSLSGSAIMTDGHDFGPAIMADSHDFDDVIASQQEINKLSNEVGRLRAECSHWKELASGQGGAKPMFHIGEDEISASDEMTELKTKIKNLEEKLRREVDESQHELSALQDSHSHKLKTMAKKHKSEVDDFQRRIESLENMVGLGATSPSPSSATDTDDGSDLQKKVLELEGILRETRRQVAELEEANHQHEKENSRLVESERESTRLVQTLKRKVDALEKERSGQSQEVKGHTEADVANLKEERDQLREEVEHLMKVVNRQETELEQILGSHEQASTSAMLEDIHDARRKFSTEEALRRSKLLREKQDIVNKMMEAGQKISDSKSTVATLEAASVDISDKAAEIVSDMGCQQHQEITADFVNSLEKENDLLKHHVSKLQSEIDDLNRSCESLADDKKQCEELIVSLTQKVNKLSGDYPTVSSVSIRVPNTQGNLAPDHFLSDSELTPNATGESDVDAPEGGSTPVRHHIAYHRPLSPSDSSVASDVSSSMRGGWTSETELSSDGGLLMESKRSLADDVVSFDGEYDDSIMFNGIKERFPEAADAFKEQLTQFEAVRADWEMEKQALEEVVVRMRDQLKEKDRIIQDMTAEKGLMSVHNENIEDLEEKLKSLEDINVSLVKEKESTKLRMTEITYQLRGMEKEKEDGSHLVTSLQKERDELQEKLTQLETESRAMRIDLDARTASEGSEVTQLREEKERLELDLQELDAGHQAALNQIISSRDNLMKEIKEKDSQIQQIASEHGKALDQIISSRDNLMQEIKEKDKKLVQAHDRAAMVEADLDRAMDEKAELESELDTLRDDLSTSRTDLLDATQMKQEQSVAMTTLRTKLQSIQDEHNELLKSYGELQKTLDNSVPKDQTCETELVTRQASSAENLDNMPSREELQAKVGDLTARLALFESKEKDQKGPGPDESVAYLEHELSRTHHEIDELNKSIDEREIKLQELIRSEREHQHVLKQRDSDIEAVKEVNDVLLRDIDLLQVENNGLKMEVESHNAQIIELQGELAQSQDILRNLNSGISARDHAEKQQQSHLDDLERTCKELKADLLAKEELLESANDRKAEIAELVAQKEEDIRALAEENTHFLKNTEESKAKISELDAKVKLLESVQQDLEQKEYDLDHLQSELQHANETLSQKSSKEQEYLQALKEKEMSICRLQEEVNQKDCMQSLSKQNSNSARQDEEIQEQSEPNLRERLKEKEELLIQLQNQVSNKDLELSALNDELTAARQELSNRGDEISEVSNQLADKEKERDHLQREVDILQEQIKKSDENLSAVEKLEKELEMRSSVISDLQKELDSSRSELDEQALTLNDTVSEKESEIDQLNQSIKEFLQDKQLTEKKLLYYGNQIEDLQRTNQEKEEDIRRLREEVHNITMQLQQPNDEAHKSVNNLSGNIKEVLTSSSPFGKSSSGVLQGQDGAISDNEKHYEKVIQERDKEIGMLQQERQSLLTSLNEKSASTMGNSVLVDLHKNQMKVKTLESERHQMMTVLNEKTREASNLKNEVHKLLKVISAQKTALEKAQDDIMDLQNAAKGSRDGMQKEALQNLSRLIQDKDLEIQALKQKNTSLLEVLQAEAPSNSSQISDVLGESEKLQKENTLLKEEKDQLIVSIHQKHQESLAYYEEVQRLVAVINSEMQKYGALEKQHQELRTEVESLTESMNQSQMEQQETCKEKESLSEELEEKQKLVAELQSQMSDLDRAKSNLLTQVKELEQYCSRKDEEVNNKDSEISTLNLTIENLNKQSQPIVPVESEVEETVIRAETALLQAASPPENHHQLMEEKDSEIADLRTQLQSVKAHLQANEKLLKSKEDLLKSKEEMLMSKDQAEETERVKEQLDSQSHALLEMDALMQDRSMQLEQKKVEVATLKQHVDRQDQMILERESTLQKQSHDLQRLQQDLQGKTEEAHTLRQHTQQLGARLQAVEAELAKCLQEITGQQHLVHNKDGELRQLQDLLARTGAEIREKDFEIGALQDKCKTLTRLVDEKETDSKGEVRRLLTEAEAMQTQAQRFQSERDQTLLALDKCQRDLQLLQQEADTRAANEQKLIKELERLRTHLIQMEDAYTQEALQSEEREKELRNRLSVAEEQAHSSTNAVQSASKEAMAQMETLRDQLTAATEQKDQALLQLSMVQEESEEYILSLNNLQLVLEQFQQEKDASIAAEVEVYEIKAREKERIAADLHKRTLELEERLSSAQEALDIASRLSEQLDKKEETLERLKADMHKKDEALEEFHRRFEEVSNSTESKVDKPLVKNLFLNYLAAPQAKKQEVVKLISSVLSFSQEDMQRAGLSSSAGGWLSGFFRRTPGPNVTPPTTPTKANSSFSLEFVHFLEAESTPKRSPRLPVDEMSRDTHHPRSSINPFSAPIPQHSPFIQGNPHMNSLGASPGSRGPGAAHPFLKSTGQPATPIGVTQPVIAAATSLPAGSISAGGAATPVAMFAPIPVKEGAPQGRGSPKGQAAGLGELLH